MHAKTFLALLGLLSLPYLPLAAASDSDTYLGSRARDVWNVVQEGIYDELPAYKVTTASFFGFLKDKLQDAASRTLNTRDDTLPSFRKLLHANGICLLGSWQITEDNPYSGYFRPGTEAVIIARASTALSATQVGEKRAFGLAGKIFPTNVLDHSDPLPTANFFVIDTLAGTYAEHYRDTAMSNDISDLNLGLDNTPQLLVAAAAGRALTAAELLAGGKDAFVRQLYPISELGETGQDPIITPKWLRIVGPGGDVVSADFRDELRIDNNGGTLNFQIQVTSDGDRGKAKPWKTIGTMSFTESVTSLGCDTRLHFAHPKWRRDLSYTP